MKLRHLLAAGLAAAALHAPLAAQRTPSTHVRCDGNPDNVSAGETAARLLGAVTLLGLFAPPPEAPDHSQRLAGAEGVAICREALGGESNDVRRAQLILATAIHQIEAGDHDAAIASVRQAETDRPALTGTMPYRTSLGLAAMEIEALALLGAGRVDEARAKAFEMAAAAPYDVVASLRAARFVRLTDRFGPDEQAFYANLVAIFPAAMLDRAIQRQLAGDFQGSAADYELWMQLERSLLDKPSMSTLAHAAIANALAGNVERAEALAGEARRTMEAEPNSDSAPTASEILDLYQIWRSAREGRAGDARLLFGSRTSWIKPTPASVSAVARLLQEGAEPGQLLGSLAGDPRRWVTELLERRRTELIEGKQRFAAIRSFAPQASFDRFGANVWRDGRSRYFSREDTERLRARMINVQRDGFGTPAGYALLLHAALTAQREGKTHFMLMPLQTDVAMGWVRFGNADDANLVAPMSLEAARVIRDLTPVIGRPVRR